jgi:hypothetical protein
MERNFYPCLALRGNISIMVKSEVFDALHSFQWDINAPHILAG